MASIRTALSRSLAARLTGGVARTAMPRFAAPALPSALAAWKPAAVSGQRWASSDGERGPPRQRRQRFNDRGALEGRRTRRRQELTDSDQVLLTRTMHLDNLAWELTDEDLTAELETFGEIEKWERFSHKKGTIRVQFKDASAKEEAIDKLNGTFWLRRQVRASEALFPVGYKGRVPSNTIYVAGLNPEAPEEELTEALSDLPGQYQLRLVRSNRPDGRPGMVAFAAYGTIGEATKALDELHTRAPKVVRGYEMYFKFGNPSYWTGPANDRKAEHGGDQPAKPSPQADKAAVESEPAAESEATQTQEGEAQKP